MRNRPARRMSARELVPLLAGWRSARGAGYGTLADRLRQLVLDGRLPVHVVLPSERELAVALGTSRTTTAAAYRLLRETGFADAGQGAGTWTALPSAGPELETEHLQPSSVDSSGRAGFADGRGDFATAAPEAPPQVAAAYAAALAELPRYLPGHGYVPAGLPGLREAVASRFSGRGARTSPEEVMVTSGAVHGLRLVLGAVLSPGDRVIVESPSYPLALDAIRSAGGRAVPVPIEAGGWDVRAFADAARATGARAAYLMPDFHNPTGGLMDAQTRQALASALARVDCTIIVDETMADLDLRGSSAPAVPPPFATCAPRGAVVSLGSASKTFWGGLRLGWVRGDAALVRRLTARRATEDLGSPLVEQLATTHLLADVDTVLAARRAALGTRAAGLVAALGRELPSWVAPMPPGGLFLWCRLPSSSSTALAAAARSVGVVLTPGPRFGVDGAFESRLRLPFSRPLPELEAAVARIAPLWRGLTGGLGEPDDDLLVV